MTVGLDHEYIPENTAKGDIPGPRPDVRTTYCEVMQMGACRLDEAGQEVSVLNQTVSAHYTSLNCLLRVWDDVQTFYAQNDVKEILPDPQKIGAQHYE